MPRVGPQHELFAAINMYPPEKGNQHVEMYFRVETGPEGAKVGMAVDGSQSMKTQFGAHLPPVIRAQKPECNIMDPCVRTLMGFMRGLSGDGKVNLAYWAVGSGGGELEALGDVDETLEQKLKIEGPKKKVWGPGTKLTPALKFFSDAFKDAPWAIVLFITDGKIEDINDVKALSLNLGKEISTGKRGYLKLVVVGAGKEVDEPQLEELNDMFEGTGLKDPHGESIDMWDYSLAETMSSLWDVVKEVDFGIEIPGSVRITTEKGVEVCSHSDGIPMKLDFQVPAGTQKIVIETAGLKIDQSLAV